ncbi:hypothetical protein GCM10027404_30560 [Arthrobacter tumbae]|uniref:hypothetical protein n=1 Tax=Arthrobacter tumbae TaxID=163874 RepID=UPI0019567F51|nr:hypothetical protein [Arthrobacter tumbae]MBM7783111.1 hypothetical protein [Arthrobacter tumbae]
MSKLPSIITLAVAAALLAGCSTTAEEPDARPAATSESASPSTSPTEEETETPPAEETASEEPVEPSPEPTPEPSPEEPPAEPVVEVPEETAPNLEPLPTGPNDPFVPPPHGEPNPMTPPIVIADGTTPHVDPAYFDWVKVTPVPGGAATAPTATIQQGQTLAVIGDGYAPGQRIYVGLGWPNTDSNYIVEPATAVADQNGYFIYPVLIGTNVPPRDYVVMTVPLDVGFEAREAGKRYHNLIITAAQ